MTHKIDGAEARDSAAMFRASFDLPLDMHRDLTIAATKEGRKRVEIVRELIADYLSRGEGNDNE